jgi:hypothetical protein
MSTYTMHDAIRDLLEDREQRDFARFDYDECGLVVNRESYAAYVPELVDLLGSSQRLNFYETDKLLMEIMPDEPDVETVDTLIRKLHYPELQATVSTLLDRIKMPDGVDFEPLLDLFEERSNSLHRIPLVRILKKVPLPEAETLTLKELRKATQRSPEEIAILAGTLSAIGTFRSVPVLVAVGLDYNEQLRKQYFTDTMIAIFEREGTPPELQKQLINPASWKMNWSGAPELFAGFVEFVATFLISNPNGRDLTGHIAEVFMQEMDVDIAPYQSFEALRLCASPDDMLNGLANLKDNLENRILLEALTEDTSILPSKETMEEDLYFDLMNDYLMTRLKRHFSFPEDR